MSDRAYVYIDGESHYIRSCCAWQQIHGQNACLNELRLLGETDDRTVLVVSKAKVFWTKKMNPESLRSIYFTSATGDNSHIFSLQKMLRDFGLEPSLVHERRDLANKRSNLLSSNQVIEKPKGVDIELAVRMLNDSHRGAFDVCHLYSSDVDFLPVIRAIKLDGKRIIVHGYKNGLSDESPLLVEPDLFVDLEEVLRDGCERLMQSGGECEYL